MDSENSVMYIKSTDQSGIPLPLRIFDYTERVNNPSESLKEPLSDVNYVTKEEFDIFKDEIKSELRRSRINRNQSKEVEKGM